MMRYLQYKVQTRWRDKAHEEFYRFMLHDLEGDEAPYTRLVVYLLASSAVTREHFWDVYNNHGHTIRPHCQLALWQTEESRLLVALAAMLSGEVTAPAAASGTLAPCVIDALNWSDVIDSVVCATPEAYLK